MEVSTARVDWNADDGVVRRRAPFDLVLAADVLYRDADVGPLLSLLDGLGPDVWIADPGRPAASEFLERARGAWSVDTATTDGIEIHRLHASA